MTAWGSVWNAPWTPVARALAAGVAAMLVLVGCPRPDAALGTARLGMLLAEHLPTADALAKLCWFANAPVDTCRRFEGAAASWRAALVAMLRYARRLDALARGQAPSFARELASALSSAKAAGAPAIEPGVARAAQALVTMASASLRSAHLAEAVEAAHPHVAALWTLLDAQLQQALGVVRQVESLAAEKAGSADATQRLLLGQARLALHGLRARGLTLRRSLRAFGRAHARLAEGLRKAEKPQALREALRAIVDEERATP